MDNTFRKQYDKSFPSTLKKKTNKEVCHKVNLFYNTYKHKAVFLFFFFRMH